VRNPTLHAMPIRNAPALLRTLGPAVLAFAMAGFVLGLLAPRGAVAGSPQNHDPAAMCERAALIASRESGVPSDVLLAIALTETGRTLDGSRRPWPWTLNLGGPGHWFQTRAEAEARLAQELASGRRNIDVGCFQINHRWHGEAFAVPSAMFDPLANARHAAAFLRDLHAEFGDWMSAAGAYHSRTATLASRYRDLFRLNLAHLRRAPPSTSRVTIPPVQGAAAPSTASAPRRIAPRQEIMRENSFPLLQAGPPASAGSLVPLGAAAAGSLLSLPRHGLGPNG
jgi:hypothetical protein